MFGSVPKALWERERPADEQNRIQLVARVLFLHDARKQILVDAGVGDKFSDRERTMFAISPRPENELPFRWDQLTDLVPTHLHFDHGGGLTKRRGDGVQLQAPQARLFLQRANWEVARAPSVRERASYLPDNVTPLTDAKLELLDGAGEILPGVAVERSDGHTQGLQWVTASTSQGVVAFPSDLIPTSTHLRLPYLMGYDMCVQTLLREKESFLRQAVEQNWIVVFAHDPEIQAARLTGDDRTGYSIAERVEL
jgi:glyoxylase-like metal-dependent hydrolase (beta-lactamase superfamily II)